MVAASDEAPPTAAGVESEAVDPAEADYELSEWQRTLPSRRQQLVKDARYFRVRLPSPDHPDSTRRLRRDDRNAWDVAATFRTR